jgi:hypothetical protein
VEFDVALSIGFSSTKKTVLKAEHTKMNRRAKKIVLKNKIK